MMLILTLLVGIAVVFATTMGGSSQTNSPAPQSQGKPLVAGPGQETLVVGGGCFWCVEVLYEGLKGVVAVESGYAGGKRAGVTYQEVVTGTTGHAEVVKVVYDPKVIQRDDLLRIFFTAHDPTTLNRQGGDIGPQYRSAIFFENEEQKAQAQKIIQEITDQKLWSNPIVTTLEPLVNYTRAEDYHQDYFARFERASEAERAKMNAGYCAAVIEPKVIAFRKKFAHLLKSN